MKGRWAVAGASLAWGIVGAPGIYRDGKEGSRVADALRTWANFRWVGNKRHATITAAHDRTRDIARQRQVDWRTAAYIVALSHLEVVYKERGIFP